MILAAGEDGATSSWEYDSRPILIVTGLVQEARIAAGPGKTVICSSSDPVQLRALLSVLDPSTVRGVISFGVAGGLDPALRPGDVVVATEILQDDRRWSAGLSLSDELIVQADLGHQGRGRQRVIHGAIAGAEQVVVTQGSKAALRAATGAVAVDMESHIAAAYAAEAGLPFAALRVISDPADRALPPVAMNALTPDGSVALSRVLRGVARHPRSIAALIAAGLDFNRALRSLRGCRGFLLGGSAGGLVAADI